jgi:hydroxymethylpyrimidine pyrophosphatase-like HAD family hydrolase
MADIKLIALDLDGTTLNSKKEITPRTRAAIDAAIEKGVIVALASGRSRRGIVPTAEALELHKKHGLIVAWNGAHVEDLTSHEVLCQRLLPEGIVGELCDYAKAHDMAIMTYDREGMSISETPEDEYIVYEAVSNGIPQRKVESLPAEATYPLHKMLLTFHPSRLAALEPEMQALLYEACGETGVDYELALAVIRKESTYQNVMGDGGESYGYMQVQPRWHRARMDRLGVTDLMDPLSNFRVGCDYLAELLGKYELEAALTAYNTGSPGHNEYADIVIGYWEELNDRVC